MKKVEIEGRGIATESDRATNQKSYSTILLSLRARCTRGPPAVLEQPCTNNEPRQNPDTSVILSQVTFKEHRGHTDE